MVHKIKVFDSSTKSAMRDCILALIWPKKELVSFFRECAVPVDVLRIVSAWEERGLSRAQIVDEVFGQLSSRSDGGTFLFSAVLDQLVNWNYFDGYWFQQGRLDPREARNRVQKLKIARGRSDERVKQSIERAKRQEEESVIRRQNLDELRTLMFELAAGSLPAQKRGFEFERVLRELIKVAGIQVTSSFRITGTQIDGSLKYDGENYNLEAKWTDSPVDDNALTSFTAKLGVSMYSRGFFVSVNGYTKGALDILRRLQTKNLVLIDGEDLILVLNEFITFQDMIDRKVRAAQTRGEIYVHPVTLAPK